MRVCVCVPDLMWLREANIRSMKEAGTVIVFLVSSNISSFRVMTLTRREEERFYGGFGFFFFSFLWVDSTSSARTLLKDGDASSGDQILIS